MASIGFGRVFNHLSQSQDDFKAFSPNIQKSYLASKSTTKFVSTFTKEIDKLEESFQQLKERGESLGDKPLIVITAGKLLINEDVGYSKEFTDKVANVLKILQKDLTTKSTKSKHIFAERSGHMIAHDQPDIIVEAVSLINDIK